MTVYTFPFDCEPFVNIRIHIDYVCAFAALSSIFVCRSFLLIYSIRLCLSLQFPLSSLNFLSFVLRFLVMHALFNCFVLCLLHRLLPLFFFGVFFCRHFVLFSPLYATMIAIVIIVFIIVVFGQVRIIF